MLQTYLPSRRRVAFSAASRRDSLTFNLADSINPRNYYFAKASFSAARRIGDFLRISIRPLSRKRNLKIIARQRTLAALIHQTSLRINHLASFSRIPLSGGLNTAAGFQTRVRNTGW
jgi:hypothetical protein